MAASTASTLKSKRPASCPAQSICHAPSHRTTTMRVTPGAVDIETPRRRSGTSVGGALRIRRVRTSPTAVTSNYRKVRSSGPRALVSAAELRRIVRVPWIPPPRSGGRRSDHRAFGPPVGALVGPFLFAAHVVKSVGVIGLAVAWGLGGSGRRR